MRLFRLLASYTLIVISAHLASFACGAPPPPPNGFVIQTTETINGIGPIPTPEQLITGQWQSDVGTPVGSLLRFTGLTNSGGYYTVNDARVPAQWQLSYKSGPCFGDPSVFPIIEPGEIGNLNCDVTETVPDITTEPPSVSSANGGTLYVISENYQWSEQYGPMQLFYSPDLSVVFPINGVTWVNDQELETYFPSVPVGTYSILCMEAWSDGSYWYEGIGSLSTY